MTNLQAGAPRLTGTLLRRLWLWAPAMAGGLLAGLLAALALLPLWVNLQRDSKRLRELELLRDEVGLLRGQLQAVETKQEKALGQRAKLVQLVTGTGDLSTLLAALDQEAQRSGVQLELYEPQAVAAPVKPGVATKPPAGAPGMPAAQGGGLELPGLERQSLLISAKGEFPALLDFLRRLEAQNVLVIQSDLALNLEERREGELDATTRQRPVVLRLALSLYGRPSPRR
jgi:type IV pilus assembly protein PilO